ncbi:MAG: serine/threonine-protein kinase [Mariprofundus sp.]|nr:serine/threonine-protein kinase [Mariprofundus sp.]
MIKHGSLSQHTAKGGELLSIASIWKSDWFFGTMLTLLFVSAFQLQLPPFSKLENMLYDNQAPQTLPSLDDQIIILNIDQASRSQSGLSPQDATAFAINKLNTAQAIAIHTVFNKADPASNTALAEAVRHSGNTFLAMHFDIDKNGTQSPPPLANELAVFTLQHVHPANDSNHFISAKRLIAPYKQLLQSAAGLGHINSISDSNGITRSETLAMSYGQHYFPSLTLILAAQSLNMNPDDIRINAGKSIELGSLDINTDTKNRIYPGLYNSNHKPFTLYTFNQLYQELLPENRFKNKIILIGDAEHRSDNLLPTASSNAISRIEYSALVLQNILHGQMIQRPAWSEIVEFALLLIIGCYLIFLLPRLRSNMAIIVSSLLFISLISADWFSLNYFALWLQNIHAALLLLIGHIVIVNRQRFLPQRSEKPVSNIHETNQMLAISFQKQGMLDQAFEKFMACPVDDDILESLDALAQAFERKKQFQSAAAVYEHIASHDPIYKDIQTRILNAKRSEQASNHRSDANASLTSQLLRADHTPTLGRYEIISELGKGAMGTVYLGKDPKINRQVAIKTMPLSQEFEADELEEVKAKFFHEAEIAGMLNHPNIVTIFDAGDEQDLAYIAMEFLDGIDLSPYTKKDKLLPLNTTLKIVGKVAEALQYAHDHGVIHRDIKPANIMILKNKAVKVTDFGIAHIIETSKSKAGVVLGTPSYMSPEQLSGKKLDGRSDLFSLGVMLYELACGTRPFRAESISKLMYKIAKQPHIDIREHNADIGDNICLLINDLLSKKAEQRIGTAQEVQARIALCLRDLNNSGESQ